MPAWALPGKIQHLKLNLMTLSQLEMIDRL
jgi:hypothetical protein